MLPEVTDLGQSQILLTKRNAIKAGGSCKLTQTTTQCSLGLPHLPFLPTHLPHQFCLTPPCLPSSACPVPPCTALAGPSRQAPPALPHHPQRDPRVELPRRVVELDDLVEREAEVHGDVVARPGGGACGRIVTLQQVREEARLRQLRPAPAALQTEGAKAVTNSTRCDSLSSGVFTLAGRPQNF